MSLIECLAQLRQLGITTTYHRLWSLVVQGLVPAAKVGRSWQLDPSSVPAVAELLRAGAR